MTSSDTGTNVQEAGVDEPDVVKTDGSLLVRIDGSTLTTYDVTGATPTRLGSLTLPGIEDRDNGDTPAELLLVGDRAVVLNTDRQYFDDNDVRTVVRTVDLAEPASPAVVAEQTYDAELLSARQYGDTVRLVVGSGLPDLDFVQPTGGRSESEAPRREPRDRPRQQHRATGCPRSATVRATPGCSPTATRCASPPTFSGAGSVVVVGFDAADPGTRSVTGVATASQTVYSSTDRLYLATSAGWGLPVLRDGRRAGPLRQRRHHRPARVLAQRRRRDVPRLRRGGGLGRRPVGDGLRRRRAAGRGRAPPATPATSTRW